VPNKPSPPSPENERAFIEWLLRFGRDFELVRTIYASDVDRVVKIFADETVKELHQYDSHEALRERNDKIRRLFHDGFFPSLNNDISNIRFLEAVEQGRYMQIFVKMALLDYVLLYKYKDKLQVAMSQEIGLSLEPIYEPSDRAGRLPIETTEESATQPKRRSWWEF
jgi:hypothetical protein